MADAATAAPRLNDKQSDFPDLAANPRGMEGLTGSEASITRGTPSAINLSLNAAARGAVTSMNAVAAAPLTAKELKVQMAQMAADEKLKVIKLTRMKN